MYPYDNYPYNPYNMYQQPQNNMQMTGMQQQPQQQATARPDIEVVPVQMLQQVEQVQVQPGGRKLVMVQNEPVIAMRAADNMGLVTTDYYQLVKFSPNASPPVSEPGAKYVTEEQLESRLSALIASLQKSAAKVPANNTQKGDAQ